LLCVRVEDKATCPGPRGGVAARVDRPAPAKAVVAAGWRGPPRSGGAGRACRGHSWRAGPDPQGARSHCSTWPWFSSTRWAPSRATRPWKPRRRPPTRAAWCHRPVPPCPGLQRTGRAAGPACGSSATFRCRHTSPMTPTLLCRPPL